MGSLGREGGTQEDVRRATASWVTPSSSPSATVPPPHLSPVLASHCHFLPPSWWRKDWWARRWRRVCRHPRDTAQSGRAPVPSVRLVPGWGWGSATKPAQQTLTARTFRGTAEHTHTCPGPGPLLSLPDDRSPLHPGPDGPPPLPRVRGAPPLFWAPGTPPFSERPVLLGTLEGQWTDPARTRRSSPAWPSSWPLRTACCPGGSPRVPPLPRASPALEVGGPGELPGPPLLRE